MEQQYSKEYLNLVESLVNWYNKLPKERKALVPLRFKIKPFNQILINPEKLDIYDSDYDYTRLKAAWDLTCMIPKEVFKDPNKKFLNLGCKSGTILESLYWKLYEGLRDVIPDTYERNHHILTKMLYGVATNENFAAAARYTLYGHWDCTQIKSTYTKAFRNNYKGNIISMSDAELGIPYDTYLYDSERFKDLLKEEFGDMHFDVIIGNPPYQESLGESSTRAKPIYQYFVFLAEKLNPQYMAFIIPVRWYNVDSYDLDKLRKLLLTRKLRRLIDYRDAKDVFPSVTIQGGICFFLYDRDYDGETLLVERENKNQIISLEDVSKYNIFIRSKYARSIAAKVLSKGYRSVAETLVKSANYFGIASTERGDIDKQFDDDIALFTSKGLFYIRKDKPFYRKDEIGYYKVITSYTAPQINRVLNPIYVLDKDTVCTQSYSILGMFDTEAEADNYASYVKTKFYRFLLNSLKLTQSIYNYQFILIPDIEDYTKPWTDQELYELFSLTDEEINYIESTIASMA